MSIIYQGRSAGKITVSDGKTEAHQTFYFLCSAAEKPAEIMNSANCPKEGDSFPEIPRLKCSLLTITPETGGSKSRIAVECRYTEEEAGSFSVIIGAGRSIAWSRAFDIKISAVENMVPFEFAYNETDDSGNPVTPVKTTAGTPIRAVTTRLTTLLTFSYYIRTFRPEWIAGFSGTVNAEPVQICGIQLRAESALLRNLMAETKTVNGRQVVKMTVSMEISPHGFDRVFPDKSRYCLQGTALARIYAGRTTLGNVVYGPLNEVMVRASSNYPILPVEEELWLNANGTVAAEQAAGTGRMLTFRDKRAAVWKSLALPSGSCW